MADQRDDLVSRYFHDGLTCNDIVHVLRENHGIVVTVRHLHRILRSLSLRRRVYSDSHTVVDFVVNAVNNSGRNHGYRTMRKRCLTNGLSVRTQDVATILRLYDPTGVEQRTSRRFTRRSYLSAGPNFIWHIDGYDKLKPYGLCIHGCICGFSRKIMWLNVYTTNNDPRIIAGYFSETVEKYGGTARIVRGDFGTENVLIRQMQTQFRMNENTTAYISGASTQNQRIEAWWGYMRRQHMQYWMDVLMNLKETLVFSGSEIDKNLVQFCFMALIQKELDLAISMWNNHTIRPSTNTDTPSGQPRLMYDHPSLWNTRSYLCPVSREDIDVWRDQVEFRSSICCDADLYDACIDIMAEHNIVPPATADEAVGLYRRLRICIDPDQ